MRKRQETVRESGTVRRTTCCNCPSGCGMKVFLRNGLVTDIWGDEDHPVNKGALCPKGTLVYWHLRNPHRILYPQLREDPDRPFRRVSWDEALSFIAGRLREVVRELGPDSIAIHGDETSPFEYLAAGTIFGRSAGFTNIPYRFLPGPLGPLGSLKKIFGVPGSRLLTNSLRDWRNSRSILLYRSDLAVTDPVTFGHIMDARDFGAHLLVIDSKKTVTASKATLSIVVRPGEEHAALKGILNLLFHSGDFDEDFLNETAVGLPDLDTLLAGFGPESLERSSVPVRDLRKMVDLIGRSKPLQVITADWNSRSCLSDEELVLCAILVCLRGAIGIPGGGLNLMNVSPFGTDTTLPPSPDAATDYPASPLTLESFFLDTKKRPGGLFMCGNPAARLSGGNAARTTLRGMPLVVHLSAYPNESFHSSHVSLPMSSWLEYPGLMANSNGRTLQWHHCVAEPPGECRSPLDFWTGLSVTLHGTNLLPWGFENSIADSEAAADYFLSRNPLTRAAAVRYLDPEKNPPGGLLWPCTSEQDLEFEENRFIRATVRGRNILFQRGQPYSGTDLRFPTPPGKISLFGRFHRLSEKTPASSQDAYPLLLITGMLPDYVEEYGYFVSDRDDHTRDVVIHIHPRIGKLLGVRNGDYMMAENANGAVTGPVFLDEAVLPCVVWCPEGMDPRQPHFSTTSSRALFDPPDKDGVCRSYARVSLRIPGQDRTEVSGKIARFLDEVRSERAPLFTETGK